MANLAKAWEREKNVPRLEAGWPVREGSGVYWGWVVGVLEGDIVLLDEEFSFAQRNKTEI